MTAATPSRDEHGHQWGETFAKAQFALICMRCLIRDDRPGANYECDALLEKDR